MKLLPAIVSLALAIHLLAETPKTDLSKLSDKAQVFITSDIAGGVLLLELPGMGFESGVTQINGPPGKTILPMRWEDLTDEHRMVICTWTFELPAGHFLWTGGKQKIGLFLP